MQLLEAINISLRAIGESEVVSESTSNPTAGIIKSAITQHRRSLLATGWWFNTVEQTITPTADYRITPPSNALAIYGITGNKLAVRDGWLYDLINQSNRFTEATYIKAFIDYDFEDLPEYAAQYIANRVAAETYRNDIGVDSNFQSLTSDSEECYSLLFREHARNQSRSTVQSRRFRKVNSARFV
ncbi:putative tail tubular protein A [Pantoea phage LIMElight]|uniref:Putative tail tubular protein A n=1 Tax=Pantoea phage LIMElight TaxID=881915 RepID=E1Y3U9_9CAUD|nr:tail protein [Pantoea phage LIMElight]CBW54801.1 putative tail tubular protein A [Pantoea phage LIMElight]